jgi:hypothetical protein
MPHRDKQKLSYGTLREAAKVLGIKYGKVVYNWENGTDAEIIEAVLAAEVTIRERIKRRQELKQQLSKKRDETLTALQANHQPSNNKTKEKGHEVQQ